MRDHAGPLSASDLLTYNMSDLEMATHAMVQARKMGEVGWGELKVEMWLMTVVYSLPSSVSFVRKNIRQFGSPRPGLQFETERGVKRQAKDERK